MNKRIKKKRELFENEISDLRSIVERNARATNERFDKIEKQVADSNTKKSWFSRK